MRCLSGLAGLIAAACACGCATVVVPPREPAGPRAVFLMDHAGHASLVLPGEDGGATRYSYGDWRWYALERKNPFAGFAALFWPTRAALGRWELPSPPGTQGVPHALRFDADEFYEIIVERRRIAQLKGRLESIYHENLETRVFNPDLGLEFVEHPRPYTAFHNSNRAVADWLAELGCAVRRGCTLFGRWKVRPPAEADAGRW